MYIISAVVGIPQLPCCQTVRSLLSVARPAATPPLNPIWKSYRRQLAVTRSLNLIGSDALILTTCIRSFSFCPVLVSLSVSLCWILTHVYGYGNIFTGYWNEARILDPVTFNTVTVLPNIPGSVNNCEGFALAVPFIYSSPLKSLQGVLILSKAFVFPSFSYILLTKFLDRCCYVTAPTFPVHRSNSSPDLRWFDCRCSCPCG